MMKTIEQFQPTPTDLIDMMSHQDALRVIKELRKQLILREIELFELTPDVEEFDIRGANLKSKRSTRLESLKAVAAREGFL
jgi:hypothetical protein